MSACPATSVFVTTYEWPEALALCLASIAAQTVLPDEVIVADDGSGDATREVVERFRTRLRVPVRHCWHPHQGYRINTLRNNALHAARGPYVIQLDGDMVLDRRFVADHLELARRGRLVAGRRVMLDAEETRRLCASGAPAGLSSFRSGLAARAYQTFCRSGTAVHGVRGANLAYWKDDAVRVNGYDERMTSKGPNDKEFCARLVNAGVRVYNLRYHAIGYHLHHREGGRRTHEQQLRTILNDTLATRKVRCDLGLDAPRPDGAVIR